MGIRIIVEKNEKAVPLGSNSSSMTRTEDVQVESNQQGYKTEVEETQFDFPLNSVKIFTSFILKFLFSFAFVVP